MRAYSSRFWKQAEWIPCSFESSFYQHKVSNTTSISCLQQKRLRGFPLSGQSGHGSLSLHYCCWCTVPASCEYCGPLPPDLLKTWFLCCVRLWKAPKNGPVLATFKGKTDFGPSPSHFPNINSVKTVFQSITVKIMLSSKHLTANSVLIVRFTALGLATIQIWNLVSRTRLYFFNVTHLSGVFLGWGGGVGIYDAL